MGVQIDISADSEEKSIAKIKERKIIKCLNTDNSNYDKKNEDLRRKLNINQYPNTQTNSDFSKINTPLDSQPEKKISEKTISMNSSVDDERQEINQLHQII